MNVPKDDSSFSEQPGLQIGKSRPSPHPHTHAWAYTKVSRLGTGQERRIWGIRAKGGGGGDAG